MTRNKKKITINNPKCDKCGSCLGLRDQALYLGMTNNHNHSCYLNVLFHFFSRNDTFQTFLQKFETNNDQVISKELIDFGARSKRCKPNDTVTKIFQAFDASMSVTKMDDVLKNKAWNNGETGNQCILDATETILDLIRIELGISETGKDEIEFSAMLSSYSLKVNDTCLGCSNSTEREAEKKPILMWDPQIRPKEEIDSNLVKYALSPLNTTEHIDEAQCANCTGLQRLKRVETVTVDDSTNIFIYIKKYVGPTIAVDFEENMTIAGKKMTLSGIISYVDEEHYYCDIRENRRYRHGSRIDKRLYIFTDKADYVWVRYDDCNVFVWDSWDSLKNDVMQTCMMLWYSVH